MCDFLEFNRSSLCIPFYRNFLDTSTFQKCFSLCFFECFKTNHSSYLSDNCHVFNIKKMYNCNLQRYRQTVLWDNSYTLQLLFCSGIPPKIFLRYGRSVLCVSLIERITNSIESFGILLEIVIFTFSVGTVVLGFSKPPTVTTNKAWIIKVPIKQAQKHSFLSEVFWIYANLTINHIEKLSIAQNIYIAIIKFNLKSICIVNACQATDTNT